MIRNSVAANLYLNLLNSRCSTKDIVEGFVGSYTSRGIRECYWWAMLKQDIGDIAPENELRTYYELSVNDRRPSLSLAALKQIIGVK